MKCAWLHIVCKWSRVEGDNEEDNEEEEVRGWRKRARPEVVIPVAGPSRAVAPLENAIWALLERMTEHLGSIAHEVKRIGDEVCDVKEDRRKRAKPQAEVQTEVTETAEKGVETEDEDRDREGEKE